MQISLPSTWVMENDGALVASLALSFAFTLADASIFDCAHRLLVGIRSKVSDVNPRD
jgi:hypothetical protein